MTPHPKLNVDLEGIFRALGIKPPPMSTPDPLVAGTSSLDQLLTAFGMAANGGDADDNAESLEAMEDRLRQLLDASQKFPANEEASSAKLAAAGDPATQMMQNIPQMASQIAGGLAGAISGALQPFAQFAQQGMQAGSQALQAGLGAMQHAGASEAREEVPYDLFDAGEPGAGDAGGGAGGGGAGGGGTTPAAMLGPPPVPSAGTAPASSPSTPVPPAPSPEPAAPRGAMGGMPMMPPGALAGAPGAGNEGKADTKRVVPPSVKNGAPVQGRITNPLRPPEVVKRVEGKPVATRRILAPDHKLDESREDPER